MTNTEQSKACPNCGQPIPADAPQSLCPQCVLSGAATQPDAMPERIAPEDFPDQAAVAKAFPNLEIVEIIGQGGMGVVYKAKQPHLDRFIALKLLPKKLSQDPHFAERFSREGKTLAHLNHPNIVSVYDFGQVDELYFLMMEYVDGVNLREAMRAGRFSPSEALAVVPKICEALQYAHDQKILHRDIKPENILLNSQGQVKIADFGIAKLTGDPSPSHITLTSTGQTLGTPHYMAPEQIENPAEVDHRADIYSLGVVLYELLTGELPIGRFEVPSSKTDVSQGIDEVVLRALEKDRERRQSSADTLKTEVQTADQKSGTTQGPSSASAPTQAPVSTDRPKWSYKAIIAAALGATSLIFIALPLIALAFRDGSSATIPFVYPIFVASLIGCVGSILGWVALSDIRHARGGLFGLPIGVFGALAFPIPCLAAVICGVPHIMALRMDANSPLSPFSWMLLGTLTLILSIMIIVMTCRWGKGEPTWKPLTRNQKLGIAAIFVLGVLFLFPFQRRDSRSSELARQPDPRTIITPRAEQSSGAAALDQWVDLSVLSVDLTENADNPRIELKFHQTAQNAAIQWNANGRFQDFPNGLTESSILHANRDASYDPPLHKVIVDLPPYLSEADKQGILIDARGNWQGRQLKIYPGDVYPVLTIPQPQGKPVRLEVVGMLEDTSD